jgi:hypothetical protein
MEGSDEFTLENLKLPDNFALEAVPSRRDQFVKVPLAWVDRLDGAHCAATSKIALHLLWKSFKDRRQTIKLANGALALKGVTRGQKSRAIQELKTLGLIKVEHQLRKSPLVTLLYPDRGNR